MTTANTASYAFRWYDDDNADVDSCTALANQNATYDFGTGTGNKFILRLGIENDNTANFSNDITIAFEVNDGGSYTTVTTSSSYVRAVTGTPTDGSNCDTEILTGYTGGYSWDGTAGTYCEDGGAACTLGKQEAGENAFCLYIVTADATDGDKLDFRYGAGSNNVSQGVTPTLTVDKPAVSATFGGAYQQYYNNVVLG